jgi:carboxylate-amine ligase
MTVVETLLRERDTESGSLPAIPFAASAPLSLGAEIEIQLINPHTLALAPRASELLRACYRNRRLEAEFFKSTIELKTDICQSAQDAAATLAPDLLDLAKYAAAVEIGLCTTGCHPSARYSDCEISDGNRYRELIDRHQWLVRRQTVFGLHVHLGMTSGEECIRYHNSLLRFLPHLLALSASSPFWQGRDTGLASCRPTTYDALPTAGQPYAISDWQEFEQLVHILTKTKAIRSLKDLWWDIRPSPKYGTLEIRCCDGPATLAEALALIAFTHMLALHVTDEIAAVERVPPPPFWMLRENKWRAIRHGLDARIIRDARGNTRLLRDDIAMLLDMMAPLAERLGYTDYIDTLLNILNKGNSSSRQRAIFARRNDINDVVRFNVREFWEGRPIW